MDTAAVGLYVSQGSTESFQVHPGTLRALERRIVHGAPRITTVAPFFMLSYGAVNESRSIGIADCETVDPPLRSRVWCIVPSC